MKTVILNIPGKDENFFMELFKKFKLKAKVLSDEDLEDEALGKWIEEGMKSEDIPIEKIFELLDKNGIKR